MTRTEMRVALAEQRRDGDFGWCVERANKVVAYFAAEADARAFAAPAADPSERDRFLVRRATDRAASFMSNTGDRLALTLHGNGMDEILADADRTHPRTPAVEPSERDVDYRALWHRDVAKGRDAIKAARVEALEEVHAICESYTSLPPNDEAARGGYLNASMGIGGRVFALLATARHAAPLPTAPPAPLAVVQGAAWKVGDAVTVRPDALHEERDGGFGGEAHGTILELDMKAVGGPIARLSGDPEEGGRWVTLASLAPFAPTSPRPATSTEVARPPRATTLPGLTLKAWIDHAIWLAGSHECQRIYAATVEQLGPPPSPAVDEALLLAVVDAVRDAALTWADSSSDRENAIDFLCSIDDHAIIAAVLARGGK